MPSHVVYFVPVLLAKLIGINIYMNCPGTICINCCSSVRFQVTDISELDLQKLKQTKKTGKNSFYQLYFAIFLCPNEKWLDNLHLFMNTSES